MANYIHPPVTEVLAEFFFQGTDWDLAIPGLFYNEISKTFPVRKLPARSAIYAPDIHPTLMTDRGFFTSEDGRHMVQIGPNLLVVNNIDSYETWEQFSPLVKDVFNSHAKVRQNWRLARVGLQYVNTIKLPAKDGRVEIDDYLELRPYTGSQLPADHGLFSLNVQFPYETGAIVAQLGSANFASPDEFSFILEIKALTLNSVISDEAILFDWLEDAHKRVSNIFEGCITDKTRNLFGYR